MKKSINPANSIQAMPLAGPIPSAPPGHTWSGLMSLALKEARKALTLYPTPEVPVGAILVSTEGEILARSHNQVIHLQDPTAHAEILALRQGAKKINNYRLNKATLVVTLEPCLMCTGALVHARLGGLVYGAKDSKAGAISSCCEGLNLSFLNHKVWHLGGVYSEECAQILTDFFATR